MKQSRVILLSLLIAAVAGAAPVFGALAKTPWSGENPGQAAEHARMPDAALEHNQALSDHPPAGEHGDHGDDDNETGDGDHDDENETGDGDHDDENETGEEDHDDENETGEEDHDDENETGNETTHAAYAPMWWTGNHSHNGSVGSGSWNFSNGTLTVTAGNLSWHGINCSWESFTWTKGQNLSDVINITCDFRGLFTVTVANGHVNVTWTNGSWEHTMGAPMAPEEAQGIALMAFASSKTDILTPTVTPVTLALPF